MCNGGGARCSAVPIEPLRHTLVAAVVAAALAEDRAFDDVTTLAVVPQGLRGTAVLVARQPGIACGRDLAEEAFRQLDRSVAFERLAADGTRFGEGDVLARASGPVRALLQGERVALNFVQRLCGIATLTSAYVEAVRGTDAVILDTRKTTPGLRELEKYAVRCGGGTNHRSDLASMAMIKDNHREALWRQERTLADGVAAIRKRQPGVVVEVEVDQLEELEEALAGKPEWVLLDNMNVGDMAEAVRINAGRAKLEASGGVTLQKVAAIAATGVDAISVGALTHSAPVLDISLELSFD
jgi:nicotinate-nucleotide pyrophosphorylase (carboxylating)